MLSVIFSFLKSQEVQTDQYFYAIPKKARIDGDHTHAGWMLRKYDKSEKSDADPTPPKGESLFHLMRKFRMHSKMTIWK